MNAKRPKKGITPEAGHEMAQLVFEMGKNMAAQDLATQGKPVMTPQSGELVATGIISGIKATIAFLKYAECVDGDKMSEAIIRLRAQRNN